MKFDRKLFRCVIFVLSFLSLIAFGLRCYTYWNEIEVATGFFSGNAIACSVYNVAGFLVFFLCLLLSQKKGGALLSDAPLAETEKAEEEDLIAHFEEEDQIAGLTEEEPIADTCKEENQTKPAPAASDELPDFCAKTVLWQGTLSAFCTLLPGFGFLAFSLSFIATNALSDPYQLIFAVLSALSGAYFLFTAMVNSPKKITSRSFFALIPSLWCTVRMVVEYRDLVRFVNKSLYIGQFLFIISTMVFFLYQAQLLIGDKPLNRPNAYAFSSLAVVYFGITCRLPQLIAVLGDKVTVDLIGASSLMIDLAITLYALIKIKTILKN